MRRMTMPGWLLLAAAFLLSPLAAVAQVAGLPLAEQLEACANCHGKDGQAIVGMPSLASQPPLYLTNQLILFREGLRTSDAMAPFAKGLADSEIEALAAHFSKLPPRRPVPGDGNEALLARGSALSKALRCGVCHLPDYAGRKQIPRLAGQREDYLIHSMKSYRDNTRGAADTNMTAVLYNVSDADIAALAHYMARR